MCFYRPKCERITMRESVYTHLLLHPLRQLRSNLLDGRHWHGTSVVRGVLNLWPLSVSIRRRFPCGVKKVDAVFPGLVFDAIFAIFVVLEHVRMKDVKLRYSDTKRSNALMNISVTFDLLSWDNIWLLIGRAGNREKTWSVCVCHGVPIAFSRVKMTHEWLISRRL